MFQVEQIVCHRYNSKGLDEYLVYWKGFDISSATWEPVENLLSCTDLIQQFQRVNNPIPGQCYSSTGQINRLSIGFQIYWISILGNCKGHRFMILQNIFELNPGAQPCICRGRRGFLELGTSINILSTTHQRKAQQGKMSEFFLRDTLKIAFQMRHITHRWTQSGYFFLKSGHFFSIFINLLQVTATPLTANPSRCTFV